jgi:hypothetical protein
LAVELADYNTFSLTFTSNLIFLITLDVILQMSPVLSSVAMVVTLPPSPSLRLLPSPSLYDIKAFGECVATQAALAVRNTIKDLA